MSFIDKAVASFTEGMAEGNRWSGRTQSRDSWSPEQLRRQLGLQVAEVLTSEERAGIARNSRHEGSRHEGSRRVQVMAG
jgi:hypothetical protein